jgi:hypothetical protein
MLNDEIKKKNQLKKNLSQLRLTHQAYDLDHETKITIYKKKNYNKLLIIISNKSNVGESYKRKNIN